MEWGDVVRFVRGARPIPTQIIYTVPVASHFSGGCLEPDPRRYIWIIWGGRGIRRSGSSVKSSS